MEILLEVLEVRALRSVAEAVALSRVRSSASASSCAWPSSGRRRRSTRSRTAEAMHAGRPLGDVLDLVAVEQERLHCELSQMTRKRTAAPTAAALQATSATMPVSANGVDALARSQSPAPPRAPPRSQGCRPRPSQAPVSASGAHARALLQVVLRHGRWTYPPWLVRKRRVCRFRVRARGRPPSMPRGICSGSVTFGL